MVKVEMRMAWTHHSVKPVWSTTATAGIKLLFSGTDRRELKS